MLWGLSMGNSLGVVCEGLEVKEGENLASSKGIKKVSAKRWLQNLVFQIEMTLQLILRQVFQMPCAKCLFKIKFILLYCIIELL